MFKNESIPLVPEFNESSPKLLVGQKRPRDDLEESKLSEVIP